METKEIWHCVFCGRHWDDGPPQMDGVQCCPNCHEYKGLEPCDPKTCNREPYDYYKVPPEAY